MPSAYNMWMMREMIYFHTSDGTNFVPICDEWGWRRGKNEYIYYKNIEST